MPTPNAPPELTPELPGAALEAVRAAHGEREGALGIAVSGGPDSLALLLISHAALPGRIAAATVDHGLRPEAANEAEGVATLCARLGVPHLTLRPEHPLPPGGNMQERARILRYTLLGRWAKEHGLVGVATAHHRDDVAESFLLRALRGSGISGLARMAAMGPMPHAGGITLHRPLLDFNRTTLAQIVAAAGITAANDPSNADPRFDRTRIRMLMAETPLLDPAMLARAAANLADADAALDWVTDQAWRSRARHEAASIAIDIEGLPHELRRRLCHRAVVSIDESWRGAGLDGLVESLEAGKAATLGKVMATPGAVWHFDAAPPRRATH